MIKIAIEKLLSYAIKNELIEESDTVQMRNELLDLLKVDSPHFEQVGCSNESPTETLETILDYCAENNLLTQNTFGFRDLMAAKIMGVLTPRSSEVIGRFSANYDKSKELATDVFYKFSQKTNYIQTDRVAKNLYWRYDGKYRQLEITINLSKPEKDPLEIAAAKNQVQSNYPKCLLCIENVGFAGHINHPARQNHRVIPVALSGKPWYLQYSPYVYYNEHSIVFNAEHTPMKINREAFERLFEFVEKFPHYFIGSNADLPIVGGSILTHDHFQGGRHVFPMELAEVVSEFTHKDYCSVQISILKWPMSAIRISGEARQLIDLADYILTSWRNYSDETLEIHAFSDDVPHNTVTPIVRMNKNGEFEMDLVLRNNRTSNEHPFGIFHPHADLHHIKKENIGLIEVMGLAVLPARLKDEYPDLENDLEKQKYISGIFERVLEDAGVFKQTDDGLKGFFRFMGSLGMEN